MSRLSCFLAEGLRGAESSHVAEGFFLLQVDTWCNRTLPRVPAKSVRSAVLGSCRWASSSWASTWTVRFRAAGIAGWSDSCVGPSRYGFGCGSN